ncbi:MAG: stage II sporulation protein D [Oscillospiraceae bacterium]|nr:stage II sporulation protein D [Oscillospiraceae bacterium]
MKNLGKMFVLALLQVGVIISLPLFMEKGEDISPALPSAAVMAGEKTEPQRSELPQAETTTIRLLSAEGERETELEEYLFGVVAAEMPASFEDEALKAQAVAARSYAMHRIASGIHNGAICSDYSCCQAWLSEDELKEKWGAYYEIYSDKIRSAVNETAGQCLAYGGEAILAAFHSSSGGKTESSENVFGQAVPYLVSVESREDPEAVPDYVSSVEFTEDELYAAIAAWDSEAAVRVSEGALFSEAVFSTSGRLISVKLCGEEVSGSVLRKIFALRSADVSWERVGNGIRFIVTGYGHGVGMSQYGANNMAKQGMGWQEIVYHYYPGTNIVPVSSLEESVAAL